MVSPTGDVKWQLTAEKIQFAEDGKTAEVLGLRGRLAAEDEETAVEAPKASIDWQRQDITLHRPCEGEKQRAFHCCRLFKLAPPRPKSL